MFLKCVRVRSRGYCLIGFRYPCVWGKKTKSKMNKAKAILRPLLSRVTWRQRLVAVTRLPRVSCAWRARTCLIWRRSRRRCRRPATRLTCSSRHSSISDKTAVSDDDVQFVVVRWRVVKALWWCFCARAYYVSSLLLSYFLYSELRARSHCVLPHKMAFIEVVHILYTQSSYM